MGRSKTSPAFKSTARGTFRQGSSIPSHLYLKGNFYYFRFSFNSEMRKRLGHSELRLNLGTGRVRRAKNLAGPLYLHLTKLLGSPEMLDHKEIKRRLNRYLQILLEAEQNDFSPPENYEKLSQATGVEFNEAVIAKAYASFNDMSARYGSPLPLKDSAAILRELVEYGVFKFDEVTPENPVLILKTFFQTMVNFHTIKARRAEGDYIFENEILNKDFGLLPGEKIAAEATVQAHPAPQLKYSEVLELYVARQMSENKWKETALADHRNRVGSFLSIIGDKALNDINREDMLSLRETLRRLPPRWSRDSKFKGKTPEEIIASNHETVLNVTTVNEITGAVRSFFNWCVNEGKLTRNPAEGLQIKDDRPVRDLRDAFSVEELVTIFSHPKFSEGKFKCPAYFWIPVIALYTGMRLEEIAQLHCADVCERDGVWLIDVNTHTDSPEFDIKNLKTNSAVRMVPIHPSLVEIGFLNYHQAVAEKAHTRIFHELQVTEKVLKYGKQPGKQFNDLVKAVLPGVDKKTFHSLRHTFADFYKRKGLMNLYFEEVFGHEHSKLAAKQYGGKIPPRILFDEIISRLDYGQEIVRILKQSAFSKPLHEG